MIGARNCLAHNAHCTRCVEAKTQTHWCRKYSIQFFSCLRLFQFSHQVTKSNINSMDSMSRSCVPRIVRVYLWVAQVFAWSNLCFHESHIPSRESRTRIQLNSVLCRIIRRRQAYFAVQIVWNLRFWIPSVPIQSQVTSRDSSSSSCGQNENKGLNKTNENSCVPQINNFLSSTRPDGDRTNYVHYGFSPLAPNKVCATWSQTDNDVRALLKRATAWAASSKIRIENCSIRA